jgi:putative tryptophan/tyrosine transport system substrate-binding protein
MERTTLSKEAPVQIVLGQEEMPLVAVEQPTKFDFVLNLKTAKALDVTVSPMLLALADEVIE